MARAFQRINLPQIIPFFVIVTVVTISYSNTFQTPFVFDDIDNIVNNPFLHVNSLSLNSLTKAATETVGSKHRFLPNISFALNYYLGGLNVFGFHAVNLIIHLGAAFIFYLLGRQVLRLLSDHEIQHHAEIALLSAVLWAVHPLHTSAVTYIVQRMTSMAALFFLLALFFYVKARISTQNWKKAVFSLSAFFSGIFAVFSKENAAMLPVILIIFEVYFFPEKTFFKGVKKIFGLLVVAFSALLLIGFIYAAENPFTAVLSGYEHRNFTLYERLLTEGRVLIHYLSLIILPLPSRLNLNYDFEISRSLLLPPQTFFALLALLSIVCLAAFLCKRQKLLSFGIVWFAANLAIESTVVPLEIIFEHRLYLPSTFLILSIISFVYSKAGIFFRFLRPLCVSLLCVLILFTWQRNVVWSSEINLWSDVVSKSPEFVRGYEYLGRAYLLSGKPQDAREVYQKADSRGLASVHIFNNWGKAAFDLGRLDEAIDCLEHAVKIAPDHPESHYNLGVAYSRKGRLKEAQVEMRKGIMLQMRKSTRMY